MSKLLSFIKNPKNIALLFFVLIIGRYSYILCQSWFNEITALDVVQKELQEKTYPVDIRNIEGLTGLMVAAKQGNVERTKALLDAGADVNARSDDADGNTALHFAVYFGDNESEEAIIDTLLKHGAKINASNNNGDTPMHFVMQIQSQNMRMRVTRQLVRGGVDMNARNNQGNTMLHLASDQNDISWIRNIKNAFGSLLNYTVKNNVGFTPEEVARDHGLGAMVDTFAIEKPVVLGANGNVNARNEQGRTGLMLAILRGDVPFAENQLALFADVNAKDFEGNTPLHLASVSRIKPLAFINMLLKFGAKVNEINAKGETPLFSVTELESPDIRVQAAALLIKHGADVLIQNNKNKTVLDEAIKKHDTKLVALLAPLTNLTGLQIALDAATKLNFTDIISILEKNNKIVP